MKNKNGFTLIELLAVIIILGVLMIIAIPSVSKYISDSRKNSYIQTAKEIIGGARTLVNQGKLEMYNTAATYYIPAKCVKTENGSKTPYGEFTEAYVGVIYDGKGYSYYWISNDTAGQGIKNITSYEKLDANLIESDITDLEIKETIDKTGIDGRGKIVHLDSNCSNWGEEKEATSFLNSDETTNNNNNIPSPVSFSTDSWETIITAVRTNNIDVYSVGDTKSVDLGSLGTHTLRISNKSTPSECSNSGFSQTGCGFVLEFVDIISLSTWNSSGYSDGGWRDSAARTYVNGTIYNALPEVLRNAIIDTYVVSSHNSFDTQNNYATDKLFLLAMREIYGNYVYSYNFYSNDSAYNFTRQLDYYNMKNTTETSYSSTPKKFEGTNTYWYTRTARSNSSSSVYVVLNNGNYNGTSGQYGISPAFRLG